MLILCSVQNFGYYGIMIWLPSYLSTRFGFGLTQSALWTAVTICGMAFGIWLFGIFADKVGRRPALLPFQAGAFVMVLVYSQLTDPTALLIGGAIMGMFVNGMLGGYGALMSELYPTEARATGAERAVQSGPRRRRLRPGRRRRPRRRLLMADGDRAARRDLRGGHAGDGAAYSGAEGGGAGVTSRGGRESRCRKF